MLLIYSAFGATRNYPDQEMMKRTLTAFIASLAQQTDKRFQLFLVGHDKPELKPYEFIHWHSLSCDQEHRATLVPKEYPKRVTDAIEYNPAPFEGKDEDMGRKIHQGTIQAGLWANKNGFKEFWMMRMDSDDLLAKDTVEKVHSLDELGIGAMFNQTCHMFDPRTHQIAVHSYPNPTTPNALKYRIADDGLVTPDWLYMCYNHTFFRGRIEKDKIPYREFDFTYCIVCNTGNSISGRPALSKERFNQEIPLTKDLIDRYAIGGLM